MEGKHSSSEDEDCNLEDKCKQIPTRHVPRRKRYIRKKQRTTSVKIQHEPMIVDNEAAEISYELKVTNCDDQLPSTSSVVSMVQEQCTILHTHSVKVTKRKAGESSVRSSLRIGNRPKVVYHNLVPTIIEGVKCDEQLPCTSSSLSKEQNQPSKPDLDHLHLKKPTPTVGKIGHEPEIVDYEAEEIAAVVKESCEKSLNIVSAVLKKKKQQNVSDAASVEEKTVKTTGSTIRNSLRIGNRPKVVYHNQVPTIIEVKGCDEQLPYISSSLPDLPKQPLETHKETLQQNANKGRNNNTNQRTTKRSRKCCAPNCLNTNATTNLFSFPLITRKQINEENTIDMNELQRCKVWVRNTGNLKLSLINPIHLHKRYHLCPLHFEDSQFNSNGTLLKTAVPRIFVTPPLSNLKFQSYEERIHKLLGSNIADFNKTFSENSSFYCQWQFENYMKNLNWSLCLHCKEKHLTCSNVKNKCSHGRSCGDYSAMNDMDPGEVPPALQGLTFIEEQLISRVHPLISVFKLKGLQLGYTGNIINFHQSVEEFAVQLPIKISELPSVLTVRFSSEKVECKNFQVRADKVLNALLWLKQNNPFYEHIEISMENIELLPTDGNVFDQIQSVSIAEDNFLDDGTDVYETTIPRVISNNQDEQINDYLNWPTLSSTPVDEFKTPGYIACAFPTLFPYGKADLRSHRLKNIPPSNYFKHLMNYYDHRFAKHSTFRYFALNSIMRWSALTNGNVFVKLNEGLDNVTVEDLKTLVKQNSNIIKKIMYYGSNLRGTRAYWYARCNELRDMVEQLSLPTFFLTLSAADLHWVDLYRLLDENFENLTEQERRRLLQENPMVVDKFFSLRVEAFIKYILQKGYQVVDHWYRIEYQHRGSPHLHGIFWIENAPDVRNLLNESAETLQEIVDYFDKLVCAINPDPNCEISIDHPCRKRYEDVSDEDEDLAQLLRTVQRHTKCSRDYCLRMNKTSNVEKCRFNFPFDDCDQSFFNISDSGRLEFCPKRNDSLLNPYNSDMLKVWRANMDIRPVLSKDALIAYLAKYIAKCEPRSKGVEELFSGLLNTMDNNDYTRKFVQRCLIKFCGERDYSAQEVCHILLGNKLYSSGGRSFTFLQLPDVQEWYLVPDTTNQNPDCPNTGFVEKYKNRPDFLNNVSLWEVAKSYNTSTWKHHNKDRIVRLYPKYHLGDNEELNEKYYRQMVLLHFPWKTMDIFSDVSSWKQFYLDSNITSPVVCPLNDDETNSNDNEQDEEEDEIEDNRIFEEEWMVAAQIGPNKSLPLVELGRRDVDLHHNWNEAVQKYSSFGTLEDMKDFIVQSKNSDIQCNDNLLQNPEVTLNKEQMDLINLIKQQIQQITTDSNDTAIPRRIIVQGKAGTGKSLIIKTATKLIEQTLGKDSFVILASTGIAALNIGGQTIHSYFSIPKDSKSFQDLTGESARNLTNKMSNLKFIIIDEFSMIGCVLLAMMEKRCCQGTGNIHEFFGGLYIIFLGDIRQLPPVLDSPLYSKKQKSPLCQHGKAVFLNFQKSFFLFKCHRQLDPIFQTMLDNISVGSITVNEFDLLSLRFSNLCSTEITDKNVLRIFSTIEQVNNYNLYMLNTAKDKHGHLLPVARVPAKHNCKLASRAKPEDADALEPILYISRGCKIMLRHNLWTKRGLVNGAVGSVVDILYDQDSSSPENLPSILLCSFDSYKGSSIVPDSNVIPIPPVTASWTTTNGIKCTRTQFPVSVAYACSIHKSQGMTLNKVVVDIGKKEFALGLTYVGLSRVKTLEGLFLIPFCFDRIANLKSRDAMLQRTECENWLKTLQ